MEPSVRILRADGSLFILESTVRSKTTLAHLVQATTLREYEHVMHSMTFAGEHGEVGVVVGDVPLHLHLFTVLRFVKGESGDMSFSPRSTVRGPARTALSRQLCCLGRNARRKAKFSWGLPFSGGGNTVLCAERPLRFAFLCQHKKTSADVQAYAQRHSLTKDSRRKPNGAMTTPPSPSRLSSEFDHLHRSLPVTSVI